MGDNPVTFLLQYLPEVLNREANFLRGVEDQVKSLQRELSLINIFLENSVGERNEHPIVREVVRQIRDVAHEAHDVIDTFILNVAKHKGRSTVGKILHSVTHANMLHDVGRKIEAIDTEIKKIDKNRERYVIERTEARRSSVDEAAKELHRRRREVEEDNVVGFVHHWKTLVTQLTDQMNPKLDVISIIGMGGLGKTTLAMKIYKNPRVVSHFNCRVWVYVSQDFTIRELLVTILKEMAIPDELRRRLKYLSENELQNKLSEYLQGKKYFVVMDDIWSSEVWNEVRSVFPDNFNGSRILITSRNKKVALDARHTSDPYLLPFLDQDESRKLLRRKVFQRGDCPRELKTLLRQMAIGCRGLPLSIVVLGGLLAKVEKTHRTWSEICGNVNWHLSECKDILALSYTYLPRHLKPCFLYLGVYPEDFEIPVKQLINLWVAEGFIQHTDHKVSSEKVAEDYLKELIDRSLVQMASVIRTNGKAKTCHVHDLLRDFCISKSVEEKFLEVRDIKNLSANASRRLSIQGSIDPYISSNPSHPTSARSLLFRGDDTYSGFDPNHWKWVNENFKLVWVLSFKHVDLYSIPTMISQLIHLRYLGIESDALKVIPDSICNLVNLETLDMRGTSLNRLPKGIWKLRRLRNLYTSGPVSLLHDLNPKVEAMWNLQVLSTVSLDLQNVPLIAPTTIRKLGIWFASNESNCGAIDVFESLHLLAYLQTLKIINCSEFPRSFPLTITKITLREVYLGVGGGMIVLGQLPILHILKLRSCFLSNLEVDAEPPPGLRVIADSFPVLEVLKLEKLEIENWEQGRGAMPLLMCVVIKECNELKMLPRDELQSLNALRDVEVSGSNISLKPMLEELQRNLGFNLLIK